jgi:hypothetical protein
MTERDATPEDHAAIRKIHAEMGQDYALPNLDSPLVFIQKVAISDSGEVVGATLLRLTAETILLLSPKLGDHGKIAAITTMQPAILKAAWEKGLDDIEARINETIEPQFTAMLDFLGWVKNRSGWSPWSRHTQ